MYFSRVFIVRVLLLSWLISSAEISPLWWHTYKRITLTEQERLALPNNGQYPTLDGFFLSPHHIFPENFYLYKVRAKRLLQNAWGNDILRPQQSTYIDVRSAISTFLLIPFIVLDHTIYQQVITLSVGLWLSVLVMYVGLFRLTQSHFWCLLGVILIHFFTEARVLRVATTMFSYPLFVLLLSILADFWSERVSDNSHRDTHLRLVCAGFIIFLIVGIDFRFVTFLAIGWLAFVGWLIFRKELTLELFLAICIVLTFSVGFWVLPNIVSRYYDSADATVRAGFGYTDWDYFMQTKLWIGFLLKYFFDWKFVFFMLMSLVLLFSTSAKYPIKVILGILVFFGLFNLLFVMISKQQIYASYGYMLFLRILLIVGILRALSQRIFLPAVGRIYVKAVLVSMSLTLIVGLNWFPTDLYKEMALNSQTEKLLSYLKKQELSHKTLLTLSYEHNFLLAYHTDCNLLLPSGFPLHNGRSNEQLLEEFLAGCHLLQVKNIQVLLHEVLPFQAYEQWKAKGRGYATVNLYPYMLLHNADILKPKIPTNASFTEKYLSKTAWELSPAIRDAISRDSVGSGYLSQKPDYILFDEVSNALNAQLPDGYELVFQADDLALFQLK